MLKYTLIHFLVSYQALFFISSIAQFYFELRISFWKLASDFVKYLIFIFNLHQNFHYHSLMSQEIAITNLNFRTTVDDIYQAFSKFGKLNSCRLLLNDRNESKGYAFITYSLTREAQEAIHSMNGFHMDGREIRVDWSSSKSISKPNEHS